MEYLTSLMQLIDLNSKIISEGDYLKMCDAIKQVHEYMKYDETESDEEEHVFFERANLPAPFSTRPRLPPVEGDNFIMYDSVQPPNYEDFINVNLTPIQIPLPDIRDRELEIRLRNINTRINDTLKKMERLTHRRNITNIVREDAVKKRAHELSIQLRRYTVGALLDMGHDVGDTREFYQDYIDAYNIDIDNQHDELSENLKRLEEDKNYIIDELINF